MGCTNISILHLLLRNAIEKRNHDARSLRCRTLSRRSERTAFLRPPASTCDSANAVECVCAAETTTSVFYQYVDGENEEWEYAASETEES